VIEPSRHLRVAERLVPALVELGAQAVAVVGSAATGGATDASDLDLAIIGEGPHETLELHDGVIVSLGWASGDEQLSRLYEPAWLGTHVPGWRSALVIHDPNGLAAATKERAVRWQWRDVARRCDDWTVDAVTGLAEEAQKLSTSLTHGAVLTAAVQRSILVLRLARPLALHRRILYGSENRLWDLLADELGAEWRSAQSAAFAAGDEGFESSCRAALRLFALAVGEIEPLLDERRRALVEHVIV
jgi:Nucleotidyltransferase domain